VGLTTLGFLKGFLVAAFLTVDDFGIWGVLVVVLGTLAWLKQAGVGDKYIQQDDADQEAAFQRAFTLEVMISGAFAVLLVAVTPLMALVYGDDRLLLPGFLLSLCLGGYALQAAIWPHYRALDFLRQRILQSVDPLVTFAVTAVLAIAGAGYWSLVIGIIVGAWAGALAAVRSTPIPLRLRYDRGTLRSYVSFSWPLLVASASGVVIAQSSTLVANVTLGLEGVGAVAFASMVVAYTGRLDRVVTGTLYPAICRRADRLDLLREVFLKSNRLALLWALPFGVGLALFARPLLGDVLGERWLPAVGLVQMFALTAAVTQIGFNWDAFYRARDNTRPIAVANAATMVVFCGLALPLLAAEGLRGLGIGMAATAGVGLALRIHYLVALFPRLPLARHVGRASLPTAAGAACVVLLRDVPAPVLLQVAGFVVAVALVTALLERRLLAEVRSYLVRRSAASAAEPATRPA
jgi:O-antigen/teichoic acid export membrane protein